MAGRTAPARRGGSKAEQSATTRAALLAEAQRHFAAKGFAATTAEDILQPLGLTRGALYHQFSGMRDLFRTVCRDMMDSCGNEVLSEAGAAPGNPIEQLRAGCIAFLRRAAEPDFARIVLTDGPAVLGWEEMAELDQGTWYPRFMERVRGAIEAGASLPADTEAAIRIVDGAVGKLAEWVATATDDREEVLRRAIAAVELLIRDPS